MHRPAPRRYLWTLLFVYVKEAYSSLEYSPAFTSLNVKRPDNSQLASEIISSCDRYRLIGCLNLARFGRGFIIRSRDAAEIRTTWSSSHLLPKTMRSTRVLLTSFSLFLRWCLIEECPVSNCYNVLGKDRIVHYNCYEVLHIVT